MRSRRRFEILWESRFGAWAEDLVAILSWVPRKPVDVWLFQPLRNRSALRSARGFLASVLVHASAFALLSHVSMAARVEPVVAASAPNDAPVYLDLQALKELGILRALPVLKPSGPGGRPGISRTPHLQQDPQPVLQASTASNPKFTIVVNPLKPDNNRQTIQQKLAPPDLKISVEQQLPDIVLVDGPAAPKPQVDLTFHQPVAPENLAGQNAAPAPNIASNAPELPMKIAPSVPQPKMPASYFTSNSLQAPHEVAASATHGDTNANSSADASGGVVVVSVEPAAFSQLASLALGNRYGALAIAPSRVGAGSPGGKPNVAAGSNSSGPGAGGDASVGLGPGNAGAGGGAGAEPAEKANLSALGGSGRSGGVDANGLLGPVLPAAVYPVSISPRLRHAPLVISAGPIGGGGLDVYGALTCGKVYSIFLTMPGKNWALQYCAHETGAASKPEPSTAGVVRMEAGIVPPSPEQQFDFRRLPVPDKDSDKLIVLQGMIEKDGSVSNVRVFRGVLPEMDAEALQAFGNWKFKPATRAGAPIALDVLVGVPAKRPETTSAAASGVQISR